MSKKNKESPQTPATQGAKVVSENRKARHDYHIIEEFEAGLVLTGPEIKSIRLNGISLGESYVRPMRDEIFILGAHIEPYRFDPNKQYDPIRTRKLLLNRHEIEKLRAKVEQGGLTIVPLKLLLKGGRAKLVIALAKGKSAPDKRQATKDREGKREADRAMRRG